MSSGAGTTSRRVLPLAAPGPGSRRRRWLPPAAGVVLAVAIAVRLQSASAAWLDEALSLELASRSVPDLLTALRRDGSPPLYYLLLKAWTWAVGDSLAAARALSALCSLAALPLVWAAGRRLAGDATAWAALLLVATSPFAVRYATEVRMYALVQLLVAAGLLAVLRALDRPHVARVMPVGLLAGALALTHYWTLFLLAVTGALLLAMHRHGIAAAPRVLGAVTAGGVLFLPWLPTFLFQVQHTGTPWAPTPGSAEVFRTLDTWAGGASGPARALALLLLGLTVLAVAGHSLAQGIRVGRPLDRTALLLLGAWLGTLVLGLSVGVAVSAGYSPRYSSVALVPALLLAALGLRVLAPRPRTAVLAVAVVLGLSGAVPQPWSTARTQAAGTAAVLRQGVGSGDVVAYCPDQLGPAVSRLLPAGTDQVVYPTAAPPALVDWVDYAERNAAASPAAFARLLHERARGAVWLVSAEGYRTFGRQCELLGDALTELRGPGRVVSRRSRSFVEQQQVARYPGR